MQTRQSVGIGMLLLSILLVMAFPIEDHYSLMAITVGETLRILPGFIGILLLIWPSKRAKPSN